MTKNNSFVTLYLAFNWLSTNESVYVVSLLLLFDSILQIWFEMGLLFFNIFFRQLSPLS